MHNPYTLKLADRSVNLALKAAADRSYECDALDADIELIEMHIAGGMHGDDLARAEATIARIRSGDRRYNEIKTARRTAA